MNRKVDFVIIMIFVTVVALIVGLICYEYTSKKTPIVADAPKTTDIPKDTGMASLSMIDKALLFEVRTLEEKPERIVMGIKNAQDDFIVEESIYSEIMKDDNIKIIQLVFSNYPMPESEKHVRRCLRYIGTEFKKYKIESVKEEDNCSIQLKEIALGSTK